jgi:hypothetical protein
VAAPRGFFLRRISSPQRMFEKNKTTEKDTFFILAKDTLVAQPLTQSGGCSWTNFLVLQSCVCSIRSSTMPDAEASMKNSIAPSDENVRSAPVSPDMLEALAKSYQEHFQIFVKLKMDEIDYISVFIVLIEKGKRPNQRIPKNVWENVLKDVSAQFSMGCQSPMLKKLDS